MGKISFSEMPHGWTVYLDRIEIGSLDVQGYFFGNELFYECLTREERAEVDLAIWRHKYEELPSGT